MRVTKPTDVVTGVEAGVETGVEAGLSLNAGVQEAAVRKWTWPLAVALGLAFAPSTALAYTVEAPGLDDLLAGKYKSGLATLRAAAKKGDGPANTIIGSVYRAGFGVKVDHKTAMDWFKTGARRGHAQSEVILGYEYWKGRRVKKDLARAARLLKSAARKGDPFAQYLTGQFNVKGIGGPVNVKEGLRWLGDSRKQGYVWATFELGKMFGAASSAKSKKTSFSLIRQAGAFGLPEAQRMTARSYYKGTGGALQNYRKAYAWASTAARLGDGDAQLLAGFLKSSGKGTKKNVKLASTLYRLSAEQGVSAAMYNLGLEHARKASRAASRVQAHKWFNLSASQGYGKAVARRDKLARKMSAREVDLAQRAAGKWKKKKRLKDYKLRSSGTGFFINVGHTVVTNEHVIANCARVAIQADGRTWPNVKVLGADRVNDLALLTVRLRPGEALRHRVARIAPRRESEIGESLIVFGYPLSGTLSANGVLTTGTLNANEGLRGDRNRLQIQVPIHPGNSGGAVFDEKGRVIGVVKSYLPPHKRGGQTIRPQNVNFAIKGKVLSRMLDRFHQAHYPLKDSANGDEAPLSVKERARIAKQSSVRVLCYGY